MVAEAEETLATAVVVAGGEPAAALRPAADDVPSVVPQSPPEPEGAERADRSTAAPVRACVACAGEEEWPDWRWCTLVGSAEIRKEQLLDARVEWERVEQTNRRLQVLRACAPLQNHCGHDRHAQGSGAQRLALLQHELYVSSKLITYK